MPIVVEVAFKPLGPMTPFAPGDLDLRPDEAVIVESAHGSDFGFVKTKARAVPDAEVPRRCGACCGGRRRTTGRGASAASGAPPRRSGSARRRSPGCACP